MSWLGRLFGRKSPDKLRPQRLDYLNEALALERQGDYDAALTSYRLALRDKPDDYVVLQNMAIAYSKTGRLDDAIRAYRRALEVRPHLAGAHYGLAFLLIRKGDVSGADRHLMAFLANPPQETEGAQWIEHAQRTLDKLRMPSAEPDAPGADVPPSDSRGA